MISAVTKWKASRRNKFPENDNEIRFNEAKTCKQNAKANSFLETARLFRNEFVRNRHFGTEGDTSDPGLILGENIKHTKTWQPAITDQNCIHEEIKGRLNSANSLLSSRLLSKT
jgi:hypothetical protein